MARKPYCVGAGAIFATYVDVLFHRKGGSFSQKCPPEPVVLVYARRKSADCSPKLASYLHKEVSHAFQQESGFPE
jgi:hypothetical protein